MATSECLVNSAQVPCEGFVFDALRTAVRNFLRVYLPLGLKPGERLLDIGSNIGTLGHFLKYFGIHTVNTELLLKMYLSIYLMRNARQECLEIRFLLN